MLKGTISGKMAPKGARSRQLVSGGGALGASWRPSEGGFGLDLWHCSACCPLSLPFLSRIRNHFGEASVCAGGPHVLSCLESSFPAQFSAELLSWGHCFPSPRSHGQVCSGGALSLLGASFSAPSDTSNLPASSELSSCSHESKQNKLKNKTGRDGEKVECVCFGGTLCRVKMGYRIEIGVAILRK